MSHTLKILTLVLFLFTGYNTYADTGRDTFTLQFDKGSAVLKDAEKAKLRDIIVFRDSITDIFIMTRPDEGVGKCKARKLAKKRGKAVSRYLSEQGIPSDKIKADYDTERKVNAIPYGRAFISFGYNMLFKVQSDN